MLKTMYDPLMDLKNYTDKHGRDNLAAAVGVTAAFIWMIANNTRNPSPKVAKRIVKATDGAVTLVDLRPDIWGSQHESL